jgi:sodium-dependent dicarboxylate transporter 2/3/5
MKLSKQLFIPLAPILAVMFYFFLQAVGMESKASIARYYIVDRYLVGN